MRASAYFRKPRCLSAIVLSLLGGLCSLSGCTRNETGSYRDYSVASNQVDCEVRFRCCNTTCSAQIDQTFNKTLKTVQDSLDTGVLTYDETVAQNCLAAKREYNADCDATVESLRSKSPTMACTGVIKGNLTAGAACETNNSYCAPDLYCSGAAGMTGVCQPAANTNESCVAKPCIKTLTCDTVMRICVPPAQAGESCMQKACDTTQMLVCLPNRVCGGLQGAGAACSSNSHCSSNSCNLGSGVCNPPPLKPPTLRDSLCP